jgi:hypothetical protein
MPTSSAAARCGRDASMMLQAEVCVPHLRRYNENDRRANGLLEQRDPAKSRIGQFLLYAT